MFLDQWAREWRIPGPALYALRYEFGLVSTEPKAMDGASEAAVQTAQRLHASRAGARIWRNNSGACLDETGRLVRYGLCNDSAKLNKEIKSSDLIGCTPVRILPNMVGRTIGQFTAAECKREGWAYSGDERERAQLKYLELVMSLGGRAFFVDSVNNNGLWTSRR